MQGPCDEAEPGRALEKRMVGETREAEQRTVAWRPQADAEGSGAEWEARSWGWPCPSYEHSAAHEAPVLSFLICQVG